MITVEYVRMMAKYNSEMNRRIYADASILTDAQRRADLGLFWKSLHGTLNHLLWGDRQWMSRLDDWPPNIHSIAQSLVLIHDFDELCEERWKADAKIEALAQRIDNEWLNEDLIWLSGATGGEMRLGKRVLMVHFFNHQTHHRGQAHAALTMNELKPKDTDLLLVVKDL